MSELNCPLCSSGQTSLFHQDQGPRLWRDYYHCQRCDLVFVDPAQRLDSQAEKQQYDLHENNPADLGYRNFLSQLWQPLSAKHPAPGTHLDYGCGPGPALVAMANELGYSSIGYDPLYANDRSVLSAQYALISCTEVIEHVYDLRGFIPALLAVLAPQGWLGIMTSERPDDDDFAHWHYKNDPTHIAFFSADCFAWQARQHGLNLERPQKNVWLFTRCE